MNEQPQDSQAQTPPQDGPASSEQHTQPPTGGSVEQHKLWAILGYIIPILFFVPLVSEETKQDSFARFHANQQLLLLITWVVGWVLMFVFFIGTLVYLFGLVLMIMGIVNAANGSMKKLPLIGGIVLIR